MTVALLHLAVLFSWGGSGVVGSVYNLQWSHGFRLTKIYCPEEVSPVSCYYEIN